MYFYVALCHVMSSLSLIKCVMTNLRTSAQFSKMFMRPTSKLVPISPKRLCRLMYPYVLLCRLMSRYVISQFNKVCYDQLTN